MSKSAIKIIEEYDEQLKKDFEVDQITLMEKLEDISQINLKWLTLHFRSLQTILDLKKIRDELVSDVIADKEVNDLQYRNTSNPKDKLKIVSRDGGVRRVTRQIEDQEQIADYLKSVVGICTWTFSKQTTNMVKLIDLESRS